MSEVNIKLGNLESRNSIEDGDQISSQGSKNAHNKASIDMHRVATKLRMNESAKVSKWQGNLIELCSKINKSLEPGLKSLEAIGEELTFPVIECKTGHSDNLVGAWLMTIRLAIGKIHFPPGDNTTVAKECWEKLSTLGQIAALAVETHKRTFKPTVRQLEFVNDKYAKYVQMIGRPPELDKPSSEKISFKNDSKGSPIPDGFLHGACSASVAVFERDIILVHEQDREAPLLHIKDSVGVGNYSRSIEIVKIFIEHTTGMMYRSYQKLRSVENTEQPVPEMLRSEMSELLALFLKYDQAHRLQERLCSTQLKVTVRSLNDAIRLYLNQVEEIKLICIWVLTAVEACFNKIKESWPSIDFAAEIDYRDKYKKLIESKRNRWWLPTLLFRSKKSFWEDVSENVGKFEKYFRRWGQEELQLINLRVSIPTELSSLLFVEDENREVDYVDSPGNEAGYQVKSYYSDVFIIEIINTPPPDKGRRHHLSHTNTSVEDIELDLDEHADLPVLEQDDIFKYVSAESSDTLSDPASFLASPTFSVISTAKSITIPFTVASPTLSQSESNSPGVDSIRSLTGNVTTASLSLASLK